MRAAQLTAYGNPVDNLQLAELPEPPPPAAGEVAIAVEFAPINPNDLAVARGYFPFHPALPSAIGNEGVGRVVAVGPGVRNVAIGDRVAAPLFSRTWAEHIVISAAGLTPLPADADPQQLAMLGINPPTAALLLDDYIKLSPGDWIVQNAANSGVGRSVIAFARARGLKTINLVRRPELLDELVAAGGDLNLLDEPGAAAKAKAALGALTAKLGLDGVGGPSAGNVASLLAPGATLVVYSSMSRAPVAVSGLDIVFRQINIRGFFLGAPGTDAAKVTAAVAEGAELIRQGKLHTPIAAVYPLEDIKAAIAHAERGGKILLEVAKR